jgi:hypothetical protein
MSASMSAKVAAPAVPKTAKESERRRLAGLVSLLARVQRRLARERLVAKFWSLGPRFLVELLAHLDCKHGVGDEIGVAVRRELGWPPDLNPTPTAAGRQDQLAMRKIAARRLQQQRRAVALHRRGAARLLAIINALDSDAIDTAENFMERALALPAEAIRVTGADRLVPPPIRRVR